MDYCVVRLITLMKPTILYYFSFICRKVDKKWNKLHHMTNGEKRWTVCSLQYNNCRKNMCIVQWVHRFWLFDKMEHNDFEQFWPSLFSKLQKVLKTANRIFKKFNIQNGCRKMQIGWKIAKKFTQKSWGRKLIISKTVFHHFFVDNFLCTILSTKNDGRLEF